MADWLGDITVISSRAARRARHRRNAVVLDRARVFLHLDIDVTSERLTAFTSASEDEQRATLAVLRERTADNGTNEISLYGVSVAVVLAIAIPTVGLEALGEVSNLAEAVGRTAGISLIGLFVGLLVAAGAREWFQRDRRRELAVVWLAAYETALIADRPRARSGWIATMSRSRQCRPARGGRVRSLIGFVVVAT